MKDLSILISEYFFFGMTFLRKVREDINYSIDSFLTIIDLNMVSREFLGLSDLMRIQAFYIYKFVEVIIVNKNKDLIFTVF